VVGPVVAASAPPLHPPAWQPLLMVKPVALRELSVQLTLIVC
jgi:hypothetical protein